MSAQGANTCGRAIGKFKFASIKYTPNAEISKNINDLSSNNFRLDLNKNKTRNMPQLGKHLNKVKTL